MNQIVFSFDTILRTLLMRKQKPAEDNTEVVPPSTYVDFRSARTRAGKSAKASLRPKRKPPRPTASRRTKKPS